MSYLKNRKHFQEKSRTKKMKASANFIYQGICQVQVSISSYFMKLNEWKRNLVSNLWAKLQKSNLRNLW